MDTRAVTLGLTAIATLTMGSACTGANTGGSVYQKAALALELAKCVETAVRENAQDVVQKPADLSLPPNPYEADAGTP